MRAFFAVGGWMVDSLPMHGASHPVIGHDLRKLGGPAQLFLAEKVWVGSGAHGRAQMEESRRHCDVPRFDLMQMTTCSRGRNTCRSCSK